MKNNTHTPDFGLNPGELRLVAVGPEWALRFSSERDRLSAILGSAAIDIQHVGSTAVPGILAKPILDIAVAIQTFDDGHQLAPLLVALGYEYRGEHGILRRHYFVQGASRRTHHLHMLEQHGTEWERHIRFRDRLLGSPTIAAQYSDVKLACVSESSGSRDLYQTLKSSFIAEARGPDAGPNNSSRHRFAARLNSGVEAVEKRVSTHAAGPQHVRPQRANIKGHI